MTNTTTVKYFTGDLINGEINEFSDYDTAFADYKNMAEGNASENWVKESELTQEEALAGSLEFHYVKQITSTFDSSGQLVDEKVECLDGGTFDINQEQTSTM